MNHFMCLTYLSSPMTFMIKSQFLTSLSLCADVHHCSHPSILHTVWRKLLPAIPPREALSFNECLFSLAWEVYTVSMTLCAEVSPGSQITELIICTWIDSLKVHKGLSLEEPRLLIIYIKV